MKDHDGKPKDGDLRWCGMCARVERYRSDGKGWQATTIKRGKTLTVLIPRMPTDSDPEAP